MTQDEALKLALEALEANQPVNYCMNSNGERFPMMHEDPFRFDRNTKAITAIKEALDECDEDELIIRYHEMTIKRLEKRIEELTAQTITEEHIAKVTSDIDLAVNKALAQPEQTNTRPYYTINELNAWADEKEKQAWRNAAIRIGEELSSVGPDGYYDMTAEQWLDWAMEQEPRGKNSLAQPEQEAIYGMNPDDWKDLTDAVKKVRDGRGMYLACQPADVFQDWFLWLGTAKIKERT